MQYFYPYEVVRTKDKSVYHKTGIVSCYKGQYSCCACSKPWPDVCRCPSTEDEAVERSKTIMNEWVKNHPVMQLEKRWHDVWVAQGGSQSVSAECDWKRKHGRWDTPPKEPPSC